MAPLGFQKRYNFVLFCIFAGALFLFCARVSPYVDVGGYFRNHSAPSAFFWYGREWYFFGIRLHLWSVIPCGLLSVFQFPPVLRRKYLALHRLNGYVVTSLLLSGNVGALMIARRSFGGTWETTVAVWVLAIVTTTSLLLAIYNIRKLQIDQHRAWMLRAMVYMSCIITVRIIQTTGVVLMSFPTVWGGASYKAISCDEIAFTREELVRTGREMQIINATYPQCEGAAAGSYAAVKATVFEGPENLVASLQLTFGMSVWLAIFLHMAGIELYLHLTPGEAERLRKASYLKQQQAGMANPGSAGTTTDKWGDAKPWAAQNVASQKKAE